MSDTIRRELLERGASLVAFADLRGLPPGPRRSMDSAVWIGIALEPAIIAGIRDGPTHGYNDLYKATNARLGQLADAAADLLGAAGHRAIARSATDQGVDWKALTTPLPHKTVATRAGVGWIGKCALLVTREFGSAVRHAVVLTDAPLEVGTAVDGSQCRDCSVCVEACPAGAPTGRHWSAGLPREEYYDALACSDHCRDVTSRRGIDSRICGVCIVVCPWTEAYIRDAAGE